jgi:hypothetical protein
MWKAGYLHEQILLQAAQAAQAGDCLVAYARMNSFVQRTPSQVFAHGESRFLRLYMQNVLFVTRDADVDFRGDALRLFGSRHCALSFPWGLGA